MASRTDNSPIIAVVGQTGSGKSTLAMQLAQKFAGEIIAADSRTIYRGLDIATAKPSATERMLVPHHVLDVVDPNQQFSAAQFKALATRALADIHANNRIAYLVGGTGLYVDALLYDFTFRPIGDTGYRAQLEQLDVDQLQLLLRQRGIALPANARNPRHLIRAIETNGAQSQRQPLRPRTLIIGVERELEVLRAGLVCRADQMFAQGAIDEAKRVAAQYGWQAPGLQTAGYRAIKEFVDGKLSFTETKDLFVQQHLQLAKRQRTWFRRNKDINWICNTDQAVDLVTTFLNK